MEVSSSDGIIGTIISPFICLDYGVDVYDRKGLLRFSIRAKCCQYGVICKNAICKKCQTVVFDVFDANGNIVEGIFEKVI